MSQGPKTPVYDLAKTTSEAYAKLIPDEALPVGDPRYVPLDRVRGHLNVAESLRLRIKSREDAVRRDGKGAPADEPTFARLLITRHQGCGKTTELFQLGSLLKKDGFTVVYYDAAKEFDLLLRDISWWNVILETIWQLDDQLPTHVSLPHGPKEDAAEWIARTVTKKQSKTEIEGKLETELGAEAGIPFFAKVKAKLKSLVKTGSTYLKEVETEADRRPEVLLDSLAAIVRSVNQQLHSNHVPGLVIIIDGLEKMPFRQQSPGITSHSAMFIHNGDKLKSPPCHLLYTLPLTLLSDKPVAQVFPDEPVIMPVVHVIDRAGQPDDEGVGVMVDLVHRRVVPALLEHGVARSLALASGGHVRDFIRLARAAAGRFGATITPAHADAAIQDMIDYYDNLYASRYHEALTLVHEQRLLPRGDFDATAERSATLTSRRPRTMLYILHQGNHPDLNYHEGINVEPSWYYWGL